MDRLLYIITICPALAVPALQLAVQHIFKTRDVDLYRNVAGTYDVTAANSQLPPAAEVAPLDQAWYDEWSSKNLSEKTRLEVELKTYTSNMIKESIRMTHRDLGRFYQSVGDYTAALKHFTKIRESCTTSQHVVDMCIAILELLILQGNYSHISTYVFKADTALDAASNAASAAAAPAAPGAGPAKKSQERAKWQTKLDFASALSNLGQGNYEKAANLFLKLGSVKELGDWAGKLIAPGDIGIAGTLCALASLPRSAIKSQLLENESFSIYIEHEPHVREIVEAYMASKFSTVLDLLERHSTRHVVDIHFGQHVKNLTDLIKSRALVLYFQPFSSIKLERMATAFGWTIQQVEEQVVNLIQAGEIRGRVDSQNKILKAKETDPRSELFDRALRSGKEMQATNRKLLLRMRLQQADLIVKAPKNRGEGGAPRQTEFFNE